MFLSLIIALISCNATKKKNLEANVISEKMDYAIVIHGGAGYITSTNISNDQAEKYKASLEEALEKGTEILKAGGKSIDAVTETIKILENNPLFNAGKGAVFASDTTIQMDASIMNGYNDNAGAVAGVRTVKNPITAARAVMEKSQHVLLSGQGADQFAKEVGCEIVDPTYFETEKSLQALYRAKSSTGMLFETSHDFKMGTVGCVALDINGNITAGTSTGGMTNKQYNRIGDSPIIAAGTYADKNCGISSTGHGEYFIRYVVAHDIASRVKYLGESIGQAANYVINEKLVEKGGVGGIIALDKYGNVTMPFNTPGMFRGYANPSKSEVYLFK